MCIIACNRGILEASGQSKRLSPVNASLLRTINELVTAMSHGLNGNTTLSAPGGSDIA